MLIYLAGPIETSSADPRPWRKEAATRLAFGGHWTFCPVSAFTPPSTTVNSADLMDHAKVAAVNRSVVRNYCDAVLVGYIDAGQWGFETVREIELAKSHDKRVVVFGPELPGLGARDLDWLPTLEEALTCLMRTESA